MSAMEKRGLRDFVRGDAVMGNLSTGTQIALGGFLVLLTAAPVALFIWALLTGWGDSGCV